VGHLYNPSFLGQLILIHFSPFVQRVWIALELKGIPYQYIEVDPYQKPQSLLEVNPRGLVPALRHGDWGSYESSVLLEYVSLFHPIFQGELT
jgi:glutathione S-transferase